MSVAPVLPSDVAARLVQAGYDGLFLAGDRSCAPSLWAGGDNREALAAVVADEGYGELERTLASEVLYRCDEAYPPDGWDDILGHVYADALRLTGASRSLALTGNLWGTLYHGDLTGARDEGPLAKHLLAAGPAAVAHLVPLLDDPAPILYEGSQEATLGNSLRYRVKDAAAYLVGRLNGIAVAFHDDPAQRDAEIDRLKSKLSPDA